MKAKKDPNSYISIIIDGMDQNKTAIPHLINEGKGTSQMWRLRVHLTGVIVHGQGIKGYFDYNQIKVKQLNLKSLYRLCFVFTNNQQKINLYYVK